MENYLVNPVNPFVTLQHKAWKERAFRVGKTGRFGKLAAKRKRVAAKKKFGIITSSKKASKIKKVRRNPMPLMLVNRKHRKSAKRRKMPAFAFKANPVRRSVKRSFRRKFRKNPISRKSFFSMRKGGAAMEIVTMTAYAFGGGMASQYGMNYITAMFPNVALLQSPLGKLGLRLGLAAALYQLHRVKFVGQKNATALAVGAALPAVTDVLSLVGAQKLLTGTTTTSGVGLLPKSYQAGTSSMGLIIPPQNMAGGGQEGW